MVMMFAALIAAFCVLAITFLVRNDFAREIADILFPVAGAMLLSLYLGVKAVYIEQPAEVHSDVTTAFVYDVHENKVRGVLPVHNAPRGPLDGLASAHSYNSIGDILADHPAASRIASGGDAKVPVDITEYAVLEWLSDPMQRVGYWSDSREGFWGLSGSSEAYPEDMRINAAGDDDPNLLLAIRPLILVLPEHAKVGRTFAPGRRTIAIRTTHTTVTISIMAGGWSRVPVPAKGENRLLMELLGIDPDSSDLRLLTGQIEIQTSQRPFTRFSRQAKAEADWAKWLHQSLQHTFSWPDLRSALFPGL